MVNTRVKLGCGSFGQVYKVVNENDVILRAEKEIMWGVTEAKKQQQLKEVQIMIILNHPNIVRIKGFEQNLQTLVLHLEYMDKGSIRKLLDDQRHAFDDFQARMFTSHILFGLVYLHKQRVLHRDITGSNILVCSLNGRDLAKLGDFGLSKIVPENQWTAKHTNCGTLWYKSPEILSNKEYGRRADVWALGCTVVEMLTKVPPWYEMKSPAAVLDAMKKSPYKAHWKRGDISENAQRFLEMIFVPQEKRKYADELLKEPWMNFD